jgi:hypothetical protein
METILKVRFGKTNEAKSSKPNSMLNAGVATNAILGMSFLGVCIA